MHVVVRLDSKRSVRLPFDPQERVGSLMGRLRAVEPLPEGTRLVGVADGAVLPSEHSLASLGVDGPGHTLLVELTPPRASQLSRRQQLAAAFHAAVLYGWDQLIYNHFTCRLRPDSFLVHRFGLLFSEVSASSLLEVNLESGQVEPSPTSWKTPSLDDMPYNATAYIIHSCIYQARPDVEAVFHVHVPCIVAVASSKRGLVVGLSQESSLVGPVAYHDYEGIATSPDEQQRIIAHLGSCNVLFLRNHGVVCCGSSVAHALHILYHVWRACLIQVDAMACGDFHLPPAEAVESAFQTHASFTKTGNHNLEFDALVRQLLRNDPCHVFLR